MKIRLAYLAFGMYFLTGIICMMVGAEMSGLVSLYARPVESVVLIGSAFAIGRTLSAYLIGKAAERYGPMKVLFAGTLCVLLYMIGLVINNRFLLAFLLAFAGGIGMSVQDTVCPLLLSRVYPLRYSSALSAGQAMYGVGGFAIAFLTGFSQERGLPLYFGNVILSVIGLSILIIVPTVAWNGNDRSLPEEKIEPYYSRNQKLCLIILGISCLIYCAICNCLASYMTSYIEALGFPAKDAANILTVYNLFSFGGSIAFIFILEKVREKTVLLLNSAIVALLLMAALIIGKIQYYYLTMAVSGFLTGVLFSIVIALATRIYHEKIVLASALIASTGSVGDILAPVISSLMIRRYGITAIFNCVEVLLIILSVLALVIHYLIKEEFNGDSK
ncbi:MAG: MFS transporter [Erysipelotrichaceae bacterium]|nr:MFS transporter [Erysipelotrichaceae bacterium]